MTNIRQTIGEIRQQPLISAISIMGTALAIFLIMVVVMMEEVQVAPIAPESNRDRFLHARNLHIKSISDASVQSSGNLSYSAALNLYGNLESAETTTFYVQGTKACTVGLPGQEQVTVDMLGTDAAFWDVFDFTFLSGRPYSAEEFDAGIYVTVITEDVARSVFGTTDATGQEIRLDRHTPYTVVGVVKDVPTITSTAYAQIWTPFTTTGEDQSSWDTNFGAICGTILARDKNDFTAIRAEVIRRHDAMNSQMKADDREIVYHNSPYLQEDLPHVSWSNGDSAAHEARTRLHLIYTILLLIPAINLSSMTQSRLRRRVSEMGVRRAFGCTRWRLIREIMTENLLITCIGGMAGLLTSVLFTWLSSDTLFADPWIVSTHTNVSIGMLLDWKVFILSFIFCFILNTLSCSIPAWRASRVSPVEAIGGMQK